MSETLQELGSQYQALEELLNNSDIDVDDEVLKDTLDAINDSFDEKADAYATFIDELKLEMNYAEEKIKKWETKKHNLQHKVKWLKHNLMQVMEETGKTKFATEDWKFNIREYRRVKVDDIGALTADYVKTTYTPDKQKIKEDLLRGKKVAGAELEINGSLTIR